MIVDLILIYLFILVIIGFFSALKIKTPLDFYIAGSNKGVTQVTASLISTILGSSAILGVVNLTLKIGWAASFMTFCGSLGLFALLGVAGKVKKYGKFTFPELLGTFFGPSMKRYSSLVIAVAWIGIITAQIIGAGKIFTYFIEIDYSWGVIVSGIIFTIYTIVGGQVSILKTDLIQSLLIIGGLLISFFLLFDLNLVPKLFTAPHQGFFNANFTWKSLLVLILTYSSTFFVGPDIYSRIFCAKDEKVGKKSIFLTALILIPMGLILAYLGNYGIYALGDKINLQSSLLLEVIAKTLPPWANAIMVLALLSAIMSSADTTLITVSTIISDEINKGLNSKSIKTTKYLIFIIGFISVLLALNLSSIIESLLLSLTIFSGSFIVPTSLALFGLRFKKKIVILVSILGGIIALAGKIIALAGSLNMGNTIIISAFVVSFVILIFNRDKKEVCLEK